MRNILPPSSAYHISAQDSSAILRAIIPTIILSLLSTVGCVRAPLGSPQEAMRVAPAPAIQDDLQQAELLTALDHQISILAKRPPTVRLRFGPREVGAREYREALLKLRSVVAEGAGEWILADYLQTHFEFLEVYGRDAWGEVLVSSYYEPVITGSRTPRDTHAQPLYRRPPEMLSLDFGKFEADLGERRKRRARIEGSELVPYYDRAAIDSEGALAGKGLEICWVDPVDAFFLHIQGSGVVALDDGSELRLNFADKNGHAYRSLGPLIRDKLPDGPLSADVIEEFLRTLSPEEQQEVLNLNPSYVFFRESDTNAVTASGAPATAGRTIATDARYFPKGALALLQFDKPVRIGNERYPSQTEVVTRLVVDQDTGGAITGGGRVDLFWGRGPEARPYAGRVNSIGKLWYLIPRTESS